MSFTIDEDIKILDGGLATELVRDGHTSIDNDPLWSARLLATCPSAIKKVHRSFLDAGSDVIITSSYQTSVAYLMQYFKCSEEKAKKYICLTVDLAKEACEEFLDDDRNTKCSSDATVPEKGTRSSPIIAGSVGPYGACQHDGSEYSGNYVDSISELDLINWHRPRIELLVEAGVDIIAAETIPAVKEALAIAKLLREFPNVKAWVTFSCMDGARLCHGETFSDAVSLISEFDQIFGVGVNCSNPLHVEALLKSLTAKNVAGNKIKIVYPNSGEKWEACKWVENRTLKSLSDFAVSWMDAGATWIGGCCRTTPEDIRQLREQIKP